MFDFEEALKLVAKQAVLCVGDLMLDDFVYGEVTRISPEAPTPVLAVARSEIEIGGAGNVARNIAALGARCIFVGLTGKDEASRTLADAFAKLKGAVVPHLVVEPGRHTTRKVRFVSEHHSAHLMRAGGAVGLCQGRTPAARDPCRHRPGPTTRQTGRGRSQGP